MQATQEPIIEHKVAHHFQDAEQEFESAKIGMWAFIAQEILFFSGLFVAYGIFRYLYPAAFLEGSHHLNRVLGTFNTLVLITSSFTMVMAVFTAQHSKVKACARYLMATFLLAGVFLVVKYFEYMEKINKGYLPGKYFSAEGYSEYLHIFYSIYFVATGLHALHIIIGMGLILWIYFKAKKGYFHSKYFTPVEMIGLYWHLVDIVWIFLFPLIYLL